MGGDQGSRPCVSAAKIFAQRYPDTQLILAGNTREIEAELLAGSSNIQLVHTSEVISMDDIPARVLRRKQNSSMQVALDHVARGDAQACVSGGNTGVLMALSRHTVKMLAGVKRPAICKEIPTQTGRSLLLDLGANISCSANHLVQFAAMGAALAKTHYADNQRWQLSKPKVALLNVGSEVTKGTELVKQAAGMLAQESDNFEFVGFIEGDELFSGKVDVIVCDGFVGNVALKVSEGIAKYLVASLNDFFKASLLRKFVRLLVGPFLRSWSRKKNPSLYNGAAFLGLNKTVIKSHGGADTLGLVSALEAAREHVLAQIPEKIDQSLKAML